MKDQGISIPLVIAGNDNGQYDTLQRLVSDAGLTSQVHLLKNINNTAVKFLYRTCRIFIFPSAYEGFGIPLLEAMAAGKPFLTSDIAVFRELSEDQGCYFQFDDAIAMANSIAALTESSEEQQRLINYGKTRMRDFSYDKLSQELVAFYQNSLGIDQ